jgi:hypothetical protein
VSINAPEYFDFLGSLLTTAIVNCAKWLHPAKRTRKAIGCFLPTNNDVWLSLSAQEGIFKDPSRSPPKRKGSRVHLEHMQTRFVLLNAVYFPVVNVFFGTLFAV